MRLLWVVKIEAEPFAAGAQRECYRGKQLTGKEFAALPDWKKVCHYWVVI
jgi:hypothetical protein